MREVRRRSHVLGIACRVASERLQELEASLATGEIDQVALDQCLDAIGALAKSANQTYPILLDLSCRIRVIRALVEDSEVTHVDSSAAAH